MSFPGVRCRPSKSVHFQCILVCTVCGSAGSELTMSVTYSAGIVPTKFASALVENPELREQQRTANALKRLGTPQDMAAAVAYLSSDDASYVTGESLVVAGGLQSRL